MITYLRLKNLVLIDECTIHFRSNFTVITGETGAGKTALIEAIHLSLGARADTSFIRKGKERASIEITFDISDLPLTQQRLEQHGIELSPEDPLIIYREITREGKNKAFINMRPVPLPFLQTIGTTLLELIGQHAYHTLTTTDSQRTILDQFGNAKPLIELFQTAFIQEKEIKKKLQDLTLKEDKERQHVAYLRMQVEEIQSLQIQDNLEESLNHEHHMLSHAQDLKEKLNPIAQNLSQFLPQLSRFHKTCLSLTATHPHLNQSSTLLHEVLIAMTESVNELQSHTEHIQHNPARFLYLEEKLAIIHAMKRKYRASTLPELEQMQKNAQDQLNQFESDSLTIEHLQSQIILNEQITNDIAHNLSLHRAQTAIHLANQLTSELQSLNMQGAQIEIKIQPAIRSHYGDDSIQFWMQANTGEQSVPIKDHASGGELSRLLFALKILNIDPYNPMIDGSQKMPTLIFDEIDANVGGTTARVIGQKLHQLGQHSQVICITHFPQVAAQADHHIAVQKSEINGRTITTIQTLEHSNKDHELLRMLGGKTLSFP